MTLDEFAASVAYQHVPENVKMMLFKAAYPGKAVVADTVSPDQMVLDLMRHTLPDLSAESAVGALWLAGRLEMPGLQQQVVEHLEGAVNKRSALAYVSVAVGLGLVKVREAAMRLAAAGLGPTTGGGGVPRPSGQVAEEHGGTLRRGGRQRQRKDWHVIPLPSPPRRVGNAPVLAAMRRGPNRVVAP